MTAPLYDDFVYGEWKLAWGSTFNTVENTQPRGKPSGNTKPMTHDFIYGEPTLAWDSPNRTKMVESVASEDSEPTGVVMPSKSSSVARAPGPTMTAPLYDDFVYGERKLAWGSTFNTVENTQPRGKPSGNTKPMTHDFIYGEPTLAWDSPNRTKMVESVASEDSEPTGVVMPSKSSSVARAPVPTMTAPLYDDFVYGERKLAW